MLPVPAVLRASGLRVRVTRIVSRRAFIAPAWSRGIATCVVSLLCAVTLTAGGQRLIGVTVLALPFESIPLIGVRLEGLAPVRVPQSGVQVAFTPAPSLVSGTTAPPPAARAVPASPAAGVSQSSTPVPPAPETPPPTSQTVSDRPEPWTAGGATGIAAAPTAASTVDPPPPVSPNAAVETGRSPWAVVADTAADTATDTGVTIGRTSKDAGLATAGFFSRFARRVAGSF
jgi:hypothetical protein